MLTEAGVETWSKRRGVGTRTVWNVSTIARIIGNQTYVGRWTYGGGGVVDVPAIITPEQFELVAAVRRRNSDMSPRRTKREYLVRRIARCDACGSKCRASSRMSKAGSVCLYYRCSAASSRHRSVVSCKAPAFRADTADPAAWAWVARFLSEPEVLAAMVEAAQDQPQRERLGKELEHLEAVIARKADRRGRLVDLYLDQRWSKAELDQRRERLDAELLERETEKVALLQQLEQSASDEWDQLAGLRSELVDGLRAAEGSFEKRRELVLALGLEVGLWWEDGAMLAEMRLPGGLREQVVMA